MTKEFQISKIKLLDKNPRKISKKNFERLKKSMTEDRDLLMARPVLIYKEGKDYIVYAGNQRVKAARELGWETIPAIVDEKPNMGTIRKRVLQDNVEYGEWDVDILMEDYTLPELESFDLPEIEDFLKAEIKKGETDPDEVPAVPVEPKAQMGDLYQLGEHILMCGDSTSKEDVDLLMAGSQADMIFTDPPYNVAYEGSGKNTSNGIMNDKMSSDDFTQFLDQVFARYQENAKKGAGIYVFHSTSTQAQFEKAMNDHGMLVKTQIIWNKPTASMGWGDYRWKHEPCFYAGFEGSSTVFYGDRTNVTIWDFHKTDEQILNLIKRERALEAKGATSVWTMKRDPVNNYVHPTQKPTDMIKYAIENSSKEGDIIIDLFGGSGSTLMTCELTGRYCRTMELDPKYVDVIIERWEKFTGEKAIKMN